MSLRLKDKKEIILKKYKNNIFFKSYEKIVEPYFRVSHLDKDHVVICWYLYEEDYYVNDLPTYMVINDNYEIIEIGWQSEWKMNRRYGPVMVRCIDNLFNIENYSVKRKWNINGHTDQETISIEKWIKEHNIILTELYTIPDEHKAEFKLRFL